jgi:hypothetical protein
VDLGAIDVPAEAIAGIMANGEKGAHGTVYAMLAAVPQKK